MTDQDANMQAGAGVQATSLQITLIHSLLHDAVNSLSAAMGFVDLTNQVDSLTPGQTMLLARAKKALENTSYRLERALHVARGDQAAIPAMARVEVAEVVDRVVAENRDLAEQRRITITAVLLPDGLVIEADAYQLEQILSNLIGNAVKYNRPGGSVQVDVTVEDAWVVFKIVDSGYGIRTQDVPHIFDLSYRGQTRDALGQSMNIYGLGIGLWLVRTWIEQQGGSIQVESVEGQGTTFTVRLRHPHSLAALPEHPHGSDGAPGGDVSDMLAV